MPGVTVTTMTRTGPVAPNLAPSGQAFFVGLAARGSITAPTLVRGIAEFEAEYGGRTTYSHLYDNVALFFEEGGAQAYIARVVGPSATAGTLTLDDRQTVGESTLKLDAISPGAWSDDIDVVVTDLAGDVVEVAIVDNGTTVESFTGTTVAELVAAMASSAYVVATDMGSDATPAADKMPEEGTFHLSAGDDKHANATADEYEDALDLFDIALGDGAVAAPGVGSTVHAKLISHANTHRRIAILSASETTSTGDLATLADGLNSEYAGLFAPWVQINTSTGLRYTSPEGYVAAVRNRAHAEVGPWRVPAGQIAVARSLVGLKYNYTRAQGDTLDAAKVNAIRYINNSIRLYGWRSLSDDADNYSLLNGRDLLNQIVNEAEVRLEQFVFRTIDGKGQLLAEVNGVLTGMLEPIRAAGGLFELYDANGNKLDNGFKVETGPTVNTLANLSNNEVRARVSVRMSPSAALISVTIVKVGLLSNL